MWSFDFEQIGTSPHKFRNMVLEYNDSSELDKSSIYNNLKVNDSILNEINETRNILRTIKELEHVLRHYE